MKITHRVIKNSKISYNDIQYSDIVIYSLGSKILKVVVPFIGYRHNCYGSINKWNGVIEIDLERAPKGFYDKIIIGRRNGQKIYFWGLDLQEYENMNSVASYLLTNIHNLPKEIRDAYLAAVKYAEINFKFDVFNLGSCLNSCNTTIIYPYNIQIGLLGDLAIADLKYLHEVDEVEIKKILGFNNETQIRTYIRVRKEVGLLEVDICESLD